LLQDVFSSSCPSGLTINALQRLNALRLICNHGVLNSVDQSIRPIQLFGLCPDQSTRIFLWWADWWNI
jgi:hypothetical protein